MTNKDRLQFGKILRTLSTVFDKETVSKEKAGIYFSYLQDIDIESIGKAVDRLIQTRKYPSFPSIAEIRDAVALCMEEERRGRGERRETKA